MKANKLFLLTGLLLSGSMIPITAQNKKEKKQQREQAVLFCFHTDISAAAAKN